METTDHPPLLEQLFSESSGDLMRYFSRRHGSEVGVQDLVQETFLQMARSLKEGRQFKCARGYLFGIARHLSQAAWKEQSKVIPFDSIANEIPMSAHDDRITAARETISTLEPIQREILDLRFSQNLSYAEIAEALGIPIGTVRSRLHHAIAEVRYRLESENP